MLERQSNSRQIPKSKEICSSKSYSDILYAYLQCISTMNEDGVRTFPKKAINYSALSKTFELSRQTISTKFKNLIKKGLVEEGEQEYKLTLLSRNDAALIPNNTLQILVDTLNEHSISTYVYLFNLYYAKGQKPFQFYLDQIKAQVGISTSTRSNNEVITNILFVLQKIGLIKYHLVVEQDKDNIKTVYQLDWITNVINTNC